MSKCRILLAYHKKFELLKNDIFVPVQAGRALTKQNSQTRWLFDNTIGDDTGDNISYKNKNYCELTVQYWAWKNQEMLGNPEYIGLMHYRRHLNFDIENDFKEDKYGLVFAENLDDFYIEQFKLKDTYISKLFNDYDIVSAKMWNVENVGSKNTFNHYACSDKKLHVEDYKKALDILIQKYPEYREDIETYNNSQLGYFTNIFVMKKDLFNKYSEWLFDILFQLEKELDISNYNPQEARVFGYISEWLYGIYIFHLKRTTNLKIKDLQRTIVRNVDCVQNPDNINICFSTSNDYAQHLGVAIASLLVNAKGNKNIDIYILVDKTFRKKNKKRLKSLERLKENLSINFLVIQEEIFKDFPLLKGAHFTLPTYYRYIIPKLLNKINKVIYLDCDLVVKGNIEELYNTDIKENYIGAVQDLIGHQNKQRLNLTKGQYYCNAGVLILNLDKMRKDNTCTKLISWTLENKDKIVWLDQDVINTVLEDKIFYLDLAWNLQHYPTCNEIEFEKNHFNEAKKNPKIVHYMGYTKPWECTMNRLYGDLYFKYLLMTPWRYKIFNCLIKKICYPIKLLMKKIFSLTNEGNHKVLTLLGLKLKIKRKNKKQNIYSRRNNK